MRWNTKGWLLAGLLAAALGCNASSVGSDASADAGPISDPVMFCKTTKALECDRAYECVPFAMHDANFIVNYGASLADCKTGIDQICTDPTTSCPSYNATFGGSCAAALAGDSCSDLLFGDVIVPPDSCAAACGM